MPYKAFTSILFLLLLATCVVSAQAQKEEKIIQLEEATVAGQKQESQAGIGSKTTHISKAELKRNATRSLSELLLETTPIQIKSMGQGAMATASFRGTAASHTQVLWNGISINPPQLGSFDFSQVPIYFVDDIALYHGGSAQKGGSGSLGGTVNFTTDHLSVTKPYVSIISEYASNNTFTEALNLRLSKGGFTSSTRAYYQQSDNDYRYLNKVYSKDPFIERRKEADYKQAGLMQEFYYESRKGDKLSLIGWWQYDDRSLPQSIIVNATASEQSQSSNIRTMASYESMRNAHHWKITGAYLDGTLDYQRQFGEMDKTENHNLNRSWVTQANYSYTGINRLNLAANFNYRYDYIKSNSVEAGKQSRNTLSSQLTAQYKASKRLDFEGQITGETIGDDPSIIYNVSGRYRAIDEYLTLKASNSYNHRNPTLNDLYWAPGGNPDLQAERGYSWDITAMSEPQFGGVYTLFEVTYYHMDIKDWIMWIPKGNGYIWEPVNFSNVISQGMEANATIRFSTNNTRHIVTGNYGYAHSVDNSSRADDTKGKQLPYIPRNRWNAGYKLWVMDKIWANYNASFTDVRYTSADESYETNAYTIHHIELGYDFKLSKTVKSSLSLKVENLFDTYYESTQYYPMPFRMFFGRLSFTIN